MERNDAESGVQHCDDQIQNASTSGQYLASTSNPSQPFQLQQPDTSLNFHQPQNPNIFYYPNQAVPPPQQTDARNQFDAAAVRGNISHSQQFRYQISWNTRPTYSYANQQHYAAVNPAYMGAQPYVNQQAYSHQANFQLNVHQYSAVNQGLSGLQQNHNLPHYYPQQFSQTWLNQPPSVQNPYPLGIHHNVSPSSMRCQQSDNRALCGTNPCGIAHHNSAQQTQTPVAALATETWNISHERQQQAPQQPQSDQHIANNQTIQMDGTTVSGGSILGVQGNVNIYNTPGKALQPPRADDRSDIDLLTVKEDLKTSAKSQCSSKNFLKLTGQKIEICPMEITDKPSRKIQPAEYETPRKQKKLAKSSKNWEEEGHYNRRKDYEKIDLKEKNKVSVKSLFNLAEQQPSKNGESECQENVVALIGQPGIGKTTLSKVITENILQDKMENITNINWVFYISVKSIKFENSVSLVDFLLKFSLDVTQYNKLNGEGFSSLQETMLKEILDSKNVFIAFDGLDEASTEWNLEYKGGLNLHEKNNPLLYVFGLMNGDILPNAKKLFTSRQNHFFSIDENHRPQFVAEVLGLNTESQESLCKQICPDHKDQVWKIIESNPNLSYSCYVPAKCVFITFAVWKSLKEDSSERFHSITHIFACGFKYYFADGFVKGKVKDEKYMDKIAKLAWNGFEKKKSVFEKEDLDNVGIDIETFVNILSAFVTEENWGMTILDCDRKSNFSHLIWQEYFAACYLVYFSSVDEFYELIPQFESHRWEVVTKFVFGLFNSDIKKVGKNCFLATNQNELEFLAKKTELLKLARDEMKVRLKNTGNMSMTKLVQVCSWLQEIDDEKCYQEVVPFLSLKINLSGNLLLTDVSSITEVLSHSEAKHEVKISEHCKFPHGSLKEFLENLGKPNIKMKLLDLSGWNITDKIAFGIASCAHNIEELDLVNYCKLTTAGICKLAKAVSKRLQPMKVFDISGNTLDEEAENCLLGCLHNIQDELKVSKSCISADFESKYSRLPEPKPRLDVVPL
uniref:Protein NLRC3-like n=1 Tax=Phallusia mammillata TaxID=59560 RepID=A0A6F9DLM9_9ASCI|nr:protein NLRC3-like [Phallusia mammillata]